MKHIAIIKNWNKNTRSKKIRKAMEYEQAIAGKFLLVTTTDLEPDMVMKEYKNLQQMERYFNDLKNCRKLRPVYHWTDTRTKGHVFVCVLSLLLEKLMENHTKRTFREIKEMLEPLRVNRIEVYGKVIYKRNSISQAGKEVLSDFGVEPPPRVLIV